MPDTQFHISAGQPAGKTVRSWAAVLEDARRHYSEPGQHRSFSALIIGMLPGQPDQNFRVIIERDPPVR